MTSAQMVKDMIGRALAAVRLPFRAVLGALNGKTAVQLAQGTALSGEKLEAVELFQHFGFTSGVPADSQLIVLPLGGKTAHSVIVATEHGAYRVQVESGEVCIYNQWGAKITLKKEKIIEVDCDHFIVRAKEDVQIQTKSYAIQAVTGVQYQTPNFGLSAPDGSSATATMKADLTLDGTLTSTGDQIAGDISTAHHTHQGDSGGTTGEPQ